MTKQFHTFDTNFCQGSVISLTGHDLTKYFFIMSYTHIIHTCQKSYKTNLLCTVLISVKMDHHLFSYFVWYSTSSSMHSFQLKNISRTFRGTKYIQGIFVPSKFDNLQNNCYDDNMHYTKFHMQYFLSKYVKNGKFSMAFHFISKFSRQHFITAHCWLCTYLILSHENDLISSFLQMIRPSQIPSPLHISTSSKIASHQHSSKLGSKCVKAICTQNNIDRQVRKHV